MTTTLALHHIPVCPFSQRVEILMALKGRPDALRRELVDITVPRPERLVALTGGEVPLPVLDLGEGRFLRESLVLMGYLEDRFPDPPIRRSDPYERAVEAMLVALEGPFVASGYRLVMNQDPAARERLVEAYLGHHLAIDAFLREHATGDGPWLFEGFGWAECVFTPFFQRFVFNAWYEGVDLPEGDERFARVRAWREACVAHPAAGQVTEEEIVKVYYDYARNVGNGGLVPGRERSSFVLEPSWRDRPWPPRGKAGPGATDEELGLC